MVLQNTFVFMDGWMHNSNRLADWFCHALKVQLVYVTSTNVAWTTCKAAMPQEADPCFVCKLQYFLFFFLSLLLQ